MKLERENITEVILRPWELEYTRYVFTNKDKPIKVTTEVTLTQEQVTNVVNHIFDLLEKGQE